jgi:CRP-like cAMP-binding protein
MTIILELFKDAEDYKSFASGEAIFEEGQEGDYMYIIIEGQVQITTNGSILEILSPGNIFGEMAIVDDGPRSASARAYSACKVVSIDQDSFTYYVQHSPSFAIHVMSIMAERMRRQIDLLKGSGLT